MWVDPVGIPLPSFPKLLVLGPSLPIVIVHTFLLSSIVIIIMIIIIIIVLLPIVIVHTFLLLIIVIIIMIIIIIIVLLPIVIVHTEVQNWRRRHVRLNLFTKMNTNILREYSPPALGFHTSET